MNVVLIGAGNLATNLGKALKASGLNVVQVYSRTEESASLLANLLGCSYTTSFECIAKGADVYFVSLKDSALAEHASEIVQGREASLFVHTAGSMSLDSLPCSRRGVLYPMQTFSKNKDVNFKTIPTFIEASNDEDLEAIKDIAKALSNSVYELSSDDRKYLHLSAVFCCNFANHCFALGEKMLKEHGGVPFDVMLPLIDETARKLHSISPRDGQTGPAVRWDTNVMNKQMELLDEYPQMKEIYALMSKSIHEI